MIRFLIKGLLRDRTRSLFPVLITASGVALTVLMAAWLYGVVNDLIATSANYNTGHLQVVTRALKEKYHPNIMELSLTETDAWHDTLKKEYPEIAWTSRIKFGGLLDVPGNDGETVAQAPVAGIALDLFSPGSSEPGRFKTHETVIKGRVPQRPGEILLSDTLFGKLDLKLGQTVSLIGSDMDGSMAVQSFQVSGTVNFGVQVLDRGAILADLQDIQPALNMQNAATEILGFYKSGNYVAETAEAASLDFNRRYGQKQDLFGPVMIPLTRQPETGEMIAMMGGVVSIVILIFIFIISVVLWNAGLMNGIRRYGEIGVRLAIGESKSHLYFSLVLEAVCIGIVGYILGTVLGLIPSYYLQENGLDFSNITKGSSMMMSSVYRTQVTASSFWIGIIPGVVSPVIGALISGIRIFKRETAQLFKELEV
ncbi:MAG: ABC transporter permease [Proteobacteria bacterium]|nr:ABC transporter permease [Pseudomonadota bacterium]